MPRQGQLSQKSLHKIKECLNAKNLEILSYKGINHPIQVLCQEHGEVTIRPSSVLAGSGCKLCANKRISETYRERAIVAFLQSLDPGTELDSASYVNSTTAATLKCKEHNTTYQQTPRDYTAGWRGCPKCRRTSRPEERIQNWLLENKVGFEREKTFSSCTNYKTGRKLPFDFFLKDYNLLIEYDGEHHYIEYQHLSTDLEKRVRLDKRKTDWAEKHEVCLIRIPYWEYSNIENILENTLKNSQIKNT